MQMMFRYKETWMHKVNPALKLGLFSALFVLVLFIHNPNVLINITLFTLIALLLFNGHPYRRLLLYSLPFVVIFLSSSTSMMFFGEGTTTWFRMGPIHITEESFLRGLHIGFRALNFAIMGLMLALTTKPVLLFYSLMQQFKLPPKYAYSFMASIRLIPALFEEFQTRKYALIIRGTEKKKGLDRVYQTLKLYGVPLLAQSIRRAQRIAVAMEAKRFSDQRRRTYFYRTGFSLFDVYFLLFFAAVLAASWWLGTVYPYVDATDVRHFE